jgi:hydrogenase expression/formation protein HypD
MEKVFEVCDRKWRGIGVIPRSGLRLREEFAAYDAEKVFGVEDATSEEPAECIAAQVLQGLKKPVDCSAFARRCTPATPLGAPMVSAEGACAAYYQYRRPAQGAISRQPSAISKNILRILADS